MQQTNSLYTTNFDLIRHDLQLIFAKKPLIHNLTNLVAMQPIASALLAIGASPLMAHAPEELADIVAMANALVINIDTVDEQFLAAAALAQQLARKADIPIVFGPVGAGASQYRNKACQRILESGVDIIRGNATEIMAIVDSNIISHGLNAKHHTEEAISAGKFIANQYHCVVVISGKTDVVLGENKRTFITHGTPFFTTVTGMGSAATALIAAFAAVNRNYFFAANHAVNIFTLAGEEAEKSASGPHSFYGELIDALFTFSQNAQHQRQQTESKGITLW